MKKILFLLFLNFTTVCQAGEIVIDNSTWIDEQKSQMFNAIASLIGNQGYTFKENWCQGINNKVIIDETKLEPAGFNIATLNISDILQEADKIIQTNDVAKAQTAQDQINAELDIKNKLKLSDDDFNNLIKIIEVRLNK